MKLTHDFTVPAGLDATWAAFNHLELVASCFPGATLTSVDEHDFAGTLRVKLGPSTLAYLGTGFYAERHLGGRHTVIQATGIDQRGKGTVTAKITMSFTAERDESTAVHMVSDISLTGPPAQLAPGVVEDAADRLVSQFEADVSSRFAEGLGAKALEIDAHPQTAGPLGTSAAAASKTYTYNPPTPASQTDYDVFVKTAPLVLRRLGPVVLGGLVVLALVRRVRRR